MFLSGPHLVSEGKRPNQKKLAELLKVTQSSISRKVKAEVPSHVGQPLKRQKRNDSVELAQPEIVAMIRKHWVSF